MSLFDIPEMEKELKELEEKTLETNFWNDSKNSSIVLQRIKILKSKKEKYNKLMSELLNLSEMSEL